MHFPLTHLFKRLRPFGRRAPSGRCWLLLVLPLLAACRQGQHPDQHGKASAGVEISVRVAAGKDRTVSIVRADMLTLEPRSIATFGLDSSGRGSVAFTLPEASFAYLLTGESSMPLYLEPGHDLQVSLDSLPGIKARFAGRGAEPNHYLAQVSAISDKYNTAGGKSFFDLEPAAFLARHDSLRGAFAAFHRSFVNGGAAMSAGVSRLLENRNNVYLLQLKQNYVLARFGSAAPDAQVPDGFQDLSRAVPMDAAFLAAGMLEYATLLHMYMESAFYAPIWAGRPPGERDSIRARLPYLFNAQLAKQPYPATLKAYFTAKNIDNCLRETGVTPALDSAFAAFKQANPASPYLASLQQGYDKWLTLAPGAPAPAIYGTTPGGEKLSLSDLKGKIVYVDVWATWCGPCQEEVPHSNRLQKTFQGNDQVLFLNVSVDQDRQAWQERLAGKAALKGVHILEDTTGGKKSVWDTYAISGIPRYLLINQAGRIVNAYAPRPSSGKVAGEIDRLLQGSKPTI